MSSADALMQLALNRAMSDSAEIEVQLTSRDGCRPILSMLALARFEASAAQAALVYANAEDPKAIRELQNQATRYADLVRWLRQIVQSGFDAEENLKSIAESDREEFVELLSGSAEGQDQAIGLGLVDDTTHPSD